MTPPTSHRTGIAAGPIRLLTTGGTIAAGAGNGKLASVMDGLSYLAPAVAGRHGAQVEVVEVIAAFSHEFGLGELQTIAGAVHEAISAGAAGVVVSHGTDTLEEGAYMLALTVPRGVPVVVTGSMRAASHNGVDGPANIADALTLAAEERAGALGPVVLFGNEVHCARWVTKAHATKLGAFSSPGLGPIGEVFEQRARLWLAPTYDDFLGLPEADLSGLRVPLLRTTVGGAAGFADFVASARLDGLVIEGVGGGHVPRDMLEVILAALGLDIPVVVAARSPAARTLDASYEGRGTSDDLQRCGVITAGALSGIKARLRLLVGLGLGREPRSLFPMD